MLKSLKERWNGEETKLGNFLKKWVGYFLAFCTVCGSILDYTHMIPMDWIPEWFKYGVAIAAFIGWVAGKMTKKDAPKQDL